MMEEPYFLKNKKWYSEYYDNKGHLRYNLADKAPKEVIESYAKYYKTLMYAEKHDIDL